MYKSPIEIIYGQMQTNMENNIYEAVQKYGVNVDKEELIRALQYDREQYEAGYKARDEEIVRCKDCVSLNYATDGSFCYCKHRSGLKYFVEADDFCSYGKRK